MTNTKCFLIGMASGMIVLKSIIMIMEKKDMTCQKAMDDLENKMKTKINQLNSKVQDFDLDDWKQKTVSQIKSMLNKVENLTVDKVKNKTNTKDLFKQMNEDSSYCCECDCDD